MPSASRAATLAVALTVLAAGVASGQRGSAGLIGWLRDSAGAPVDRADVEVEGLKTSARTDASGRFRLASLDPGKTMIKIRRLGFEPEAFEFVLRASSVDSVNVVMHQNVQMLETVHTDASLNRRFKALEEFYLRRAKGFGIFVTRDDILDRHTPALSETVREIPGIRIARGSNGRSGIRFPSSNSKRGDCAPQMWIDGARTNAAEIDDIPANDVAGMELYAGPSTTPLQFSQGTIPSCGTIAIWTRIPGVP